MSIISIIITVKPVLSGHTKRILKLVFKTDYRLMKVKSIAQCFRPSLSYHLSLRFLICLFLSAPLRQVLLYMGAILCHGNQSSNPISLKPYAAFPPTWWCFTWIWAKIGQLTLKTYFFEILNSNCWWRTNGMLIPQSSLWLTWAKKPFCQYVYCKD